MLINQRRQILAADTIQLPAVVTEQAIFNAVHALRCLDATIEDPAVDASTVHQEPSGLVPSPASHNILLADDNPTNQLVIREFLRQAGHTVVTVSDGRAALARLQSAAFDVAILDLHMPHLGGLEVVSRLSGEHRASLAVIVLTADVTSSARNASHAAGVDAYLTKPLQPEEMIRVLERQIMAGRPAKAS